jgi:hypothetical protein
LSRLPLVIETGFDWLIDRKASGRGNVEFATAGDIELRYPVSDRQSQLWTHYDHRDWKRHFSLLFVLNRLRHQLLAQMNRAAKHGSIDIVINSGELYRSLGGYPGSMHGMPACCDAMRSEMKPGDIVLVEQASGPGMTVRYRLPRTG